MTYFFAEGRKGWSLVRIATIGCFALGVLYLVICDPVWVEKQIVAERKSQKAVLGRDVYDEAMGRANHWFLSAFVRTGAVAQTRLDGSVDAPELIDSVDIGSGIDVAQSWLRTRVQLAWHMLWQLLVRVSILVMWIPYAPLVIVPAVVDALVVRKIKAQNFGLTSPHKYRIAHYLLRAMPFLCIMVLFAPFRVPPDVIPVMMLLVGIACWFALTQFAKRA